MATARTMRDTDYQRLLTARTRIRAFERWSAEQAEGLSVTAHQHQLLLAIRGHSGDSPPTVRDVAEYLLIRHNTAVELADRTEAAGYIHRTRDSADRRVARLELTETGRQILRKLSAGHVQELGALAAMLEAITNELNTSY